MDIGILKITDFFQIVMCFLKVIIIFFRGIIASSRKLCNGVTIIMLGIGINKYIEVLLNKNYMFTPKFIGLSGKSCNIKKHGNYISCTIDDNNYRLF